jgi:hypothetical protein
VEEGIIGICEHCECEIKEDDLGLQFNDIMLCKKCMDEYDGSREK